MRPLGPFRMADGHERLLQQLLQIRLPDVDDVVDVRRAAEHRMVAFAACRARRPQRSLWAILEDAIVEILSKQSKLPELVRDVLADVRDDAVRTHDDFFTLFAVFVPGFGIRDSGFVEILLNRHYPTTCQ